MSQERIIVDRFLIEELIGYGGMGEVYRALDLETGREVAVKQLKPQLIAEDETFVERFIREGEALRQLNHPNIVSMVCAVNDGANHYLVMDYINGGSLEDLLQKQPQLPVEQSLKIALDLADALTRAHHLQIIHRDVKPANVLFASDGTTYLTDFGTAQIAHSPSLTHTGAILGTFAYMSPEACNGEPLDARTDIWSLGVILYQMLAGQLPFSDSQLLHLQIAIMSDPPPEIQRLRPEVNDDLADLIYRMLTKDREQRIPSTRLVGAALEAILSGNGHGLQANTPSGYQTTRFASTVYRPKTPRHNLPVIATPFIGREAELKEISQQLNNPDCRLLTLHGPGGSGKTRLAIRAALNSLGQFRHGVYFVDLSAVQDPMLFSSAVASVLQFKFFGPSEPDAQLLNYLQNKELLLLLDNFEHMTTRVGLLYHILHMAPDVHLLITSRERLNLHEEWVLPVQGLPLPPKQGEQESATAVDLFLQSARRIRPHFTPLNGDMEAIYTICHLIEGLPLGIELAASWINLLTPADIVQEMDKSLDFLTSQWPDLPPRHQSMRAVSEYSWQLLKEEEKTALCGLAVFRGGFNREAAQQVAGASLLTLNAFINKSLLRRSPSSGRYDMQDLLRQFAAEKLAEMPHWRQRALAQHASYYLHYLQGRVDDLKGGRQLEALRAIDEEMGNIRAAWQWAVEAGESKLIDAGLDGLYYFYLLRGRQREGAEMFALVAQAFPVSPGIGDPVLGRVIGRQGACCRFIGRLDEAKTLLQESLRWARRADHKQEIAFALYQLGAAAPLDAASRSYWEESLALAEAIGDKTLMAEALNWLAFAFYREGEQTSAVQLLERGLALRRILKDEHGLANGLSNLGVVYIHLGDYERAQTLLQESLQRHETLRDLHGMAAACNNLSHIALNREDYAAARQWGERALAYVREVGDKKAEGEVLGNLSEVCLYQREYEPARRLGQECIRLYEEMGLPTNAFENMLGRIALAEGNYEGARRTFQAALQKSTRPSHLLDILTGMAAIMAHQEQLSKAIALLTFIQHHPASEQVVKKRAEKLLADFAQKLPAEALEMAQSQSRERGVAEYVEFALQL